MAKDGCFGFALFWLCLDFFFVFFLVPGRSRKLNEISWDGVAVVA